MEIKSSTVVKTRSLSSKFIPWILVVIGAVFLLVGFYFVSSQRGFVAQSDATELLVTFVDTKQDDDGGNMYRPTFQTNGLDGTTIEYTGQMWMSPKPHDMGDIVPGRVNRETGEMRSEGMMRISRMLGYIFSALGGVLLVVALIVAGVLKRRRA